MVGRLELGAGGVEAAAGHGAGREAGVHCCCSGTNRQSFRRSPVEGQLSRSVGLPVVFGEESGRLGLD